MKESAPGSDAGDFRLRDVALVAVRMLGLLGVGWVGYWTRELDRTSRARVSRSSP